MEVTFPKALREILSSKDGRRLLREYLLRSFRGEADQAVIQVGEKRYKVDSAEGPSIEKSTEKQ